MEKHHKLRRDPSWSPHGCNICGVVRRRLPRFPTRGTLSPAPPCGPRHPCGPRPRAGPPRRLASGRSGAAAQERTWGASTSTFVGLFLPLWAVGQLR